MSMFRTSVARLQGGKPEDNELKRLMMPVWPNIADALFGCSATEDCAICTPQYSITLFTEGELLKFCIGSFDAPEKAYGVVQEPLNGFDGLEHSIATGQFSVRAKKDRKRS